MRSIFLINRNIYFGDIISCISHDFTVLFVMLSEHFFVLQLRTSDLSLVIPLKPVIPERHAAFFSMAVFSLFAVKRSSKAQRIDVPGTEIDTEH